MHLTESASPGLTRRILHVNPATHSPVTTCDFDIKIWVIRTLRFGQEAVINFIGNREGCDAERVSEKSGLFVLSTATLVIKETCRKLPAACGVLWPRAG